MKKRLHPMASLVLIILVLSTGICLEAEMPQEPTVEHLCDSSRIIVLAELVASVEVAGTMNYSYAILSFDVHKVLKGDIPGSDLVMELQDGTTRSGNFISIAIQNRSTASGYVVPNYKAETQYVLFLGEEILDNLYLRSSSDRIWWERLATPDVLKRIEQEIDEK